MKIYIASSWRNQHGVEMLTQHLREMGCEVISWIENNYGEGMTASGHTNFEEWVATENAERAFQFDINGAMTCDLLIYYGNGGKDAAAECGMCYGQRLAVRCIPMVALVSKGEDFGLMRLMFDQYFLRYQDLLDYVSLLKKDESNISIGKRNGIILSEIQHSIKELTKDPHFSGMGFDSDIFKLKDGREAQIKVAVTVDEEEFEEPTKTFLK